MIIVQKIEISKARVFDEVAKTTAYIGSKAMSEQDPGVYGRVAVVDANREQLDRYWMEACSDASKVLDHWISSVTSQVLLHHPELGSDNNYKVTLSLPSNWNWAYLTTVKETLMSFLVNSMVAKWLMLTFPTQAEGYAALAAGASAQLHQLMLARVRPRRRSSSNEGEGALWVRSNLWVRDETWTIN